MGGGPMRTAARVAGVTVANVGLRAVTSEHCSVFSFTRGEAPSVPAPADKVKLATSQTQRGVQITCSNMDDWVFPGGPEDEMAITDDPTAKVVFGGLPTPQEAKEAISELTLELERVYLSSTKSVGYEGSFADDQNSTCIARAIPPPAPANAINAFKFLRESSMAQKVVASITCDPKVWDAVLDNTELQHFLHSEKTYLSFTNADQSSVRPSDISPSCAQESQPENQFEGFVDRVKILVSEMMSGFSEYFRHLFGCPKDNGVVARTSNADTVMEVYFMGLAVMAILVILLKRV